MVWRDTTVGNQEIFYKRSTDGGANFGDVINLSNNAGNSLLPAVASSGNRVYVVWNDNTSGNNEILYKRSVNGGATFSATMNLSNNAGNSLQSAIAASGNNVYVLWTDDTTGNNEILYRRSTVGGVNFEPTVNLSNNAGNSRDPSIATLSANNAYVVWGDDTTGGAEILYRRSTDGGSTFAATINLSNDGVSQAPAVAAFSNLPL